MFEILQNYFDKSSAITILVLSIMSIYLIVTLWIFIYRYFTLKRLLSIESHSVKKLYMGRTKTVDERSMLFSYINRVLIPNQAIFSVAKNSAIKEATSGLTALAIVASTSPFIGLFGTVWGIMNSFEGIARTGSASLAAVAPGISEALIATAFGLAAAIPAVVGYNIAGTKIKTLISKVDGFGSDYLNIVQRYLVSDRSKGTSSNSQTPRI
jgi:biopolymer transport protein ExbB/TolQ